MGKEGFFLLNMIKLLMSNMGEVVKGDLGEDVGEGGSEGQSQREGQSCLGRQW